MKRFLLWLLGVFLASAAAATGREETLAIVGAAVLDGLGGVPLEEGTIVVRDARIVAVGAVVEVPEGATLVDAQGLTAMPGLADMHGTRGRMGR